MTYEDYDKIIEEIIASPSDDKLMLENFDKLRNAYKELDEKVKSAVEELDALSKKYEDLRQTKVNEFFNREDKEEVVEEKVEDVVEDKVEEEISVDDLFEDDVEVEVIEESLADPIENTSGAMCSIMCVIFLGDTISLPVWIAIAVIVIGIIGVTQTEKSSEVNRSQKLGKKLATVAFLMPFCYAFIDAIGCVLDIFFLEMETSPLIGITEENIELVANISYELTFAIVGLILFIFMKAKRVKFELPKQGDKIIAAICETAGQLTYVYAMSGNGAIAAPILSSVCVVSLLLSRIFLKEKLTKKQYLFIGIIIVGILMLAVLEGE